METENRSTGDFLLTRLPFAHRANGILLFVLFVDEETVEVVRLRTK
jgi:hypothetical protein